MTTQFTPAELSTIHISVERLAGTVSGVIAHLQREGSRGMADLIQLGMEDIVRLREVLASKGAAFKPLELPPSARNLGPSAVGIALCASPDDRLEHVERIYEGAGEAA